MEALLETLLECLDLEQLDTDLYRGKNEGNRHGRIFGGQAVAQALVAAQRSVEGRAAHSLHGYFLRVGDPSRPVIYRVDRSREGRSFATRQVVALQGSDEIFHMIASFQKPERGYEHQRDMPDAPDPESLPTLEELVAERGERMPEYARGWAGRPRAIDMRYAVVPYSHGGDVGREPAVAWFRAPSKLSDDPDLHRALIAYATDMSFNDSAIRAHGAGTSLGSVMMSSLDHALWFHADARADEWLLWVTESPRASAGRGFTRGAVYRRDGEHAASAAQDSVMRLGDLEIR